MPACHLRILLIEAPAIEVIIYLPSWLSRCALVLARVALLRTLHYLAANNFAAVIMSSCDFTRHAPPVLP